MTPKAENEAHSEVPHEHAKAVRWGAGALSLTMMMMSVAEAQETPPAAPARDGVYEEDEVVVVGSRLRRNIDQNPVPITAFYKEDIERLGVTNVADVLNYLPQQTLSTGEQNNNAGSRAVRLRGLGFGTTLVLINGRRTVTSSIVSASNYFDLNTIPLAAVERIEVLSDSASSVYGADAVGGVVNIVLKSQIDELFGDLYFGQAEGGAEERRASFGFGQSSDRFRYSFVLDAFDRDFLMGTERDRYFNADFRRFGGIDRRIQNSNPGNISRVGGNLPGLNFPFAAVPVGSTGVGLTPASFAATQGTRNLGSAFQYSSVVPEAQRYSGVAFGEFDITDNFGVFTELLYTDRDDARLNQPSILTNANVPATNPFNPFGVAVQATYVFEGVGPVRNNSEAETLRGVAGLKGALGAWEWEVSALMINEDGTNFIENQVDPVKAAAALASTDPNTALNVFQDGPGGSAQLLQSLLLTPVVNNFASDAFQQSAFIRGPLPFGLPAGEVEMVVGAENRSEEILFQNQQALINLDTDRDSYAGFTEFRIPLIGEQQDIPVINRLTLSLAGRYDDYSDFGGTFNPQYGLEWNLVPSFMLRGSFGTSFRPPSLFELYQPPTTINAIAQDPRRANELVTIPQRNGGNPNLQAEESDSMSFGFVFTPDIGESFRLSTSYFQIKQDQRVQRFTSVTLLANEAFFGSRIVRAAQTPADIAAGRPGRLMSLDVTSANFGQVETNGFDLQLNSSFVTPIGRLLPSVAATFINKFDAADIIGAAPVDRVGVANALQGTIPELRATASLGWSYRGLAFTPTARYISSYDDTNLGAALTGRKVESQTLLDVQTSLDFGQFFNSSSPWLEALVFRLGALNALDEDVPYSDVSTQGYDPSLADLRQRFVYVSLSKSF